MNLQGWRYCVVGRDSAIELMMDNAVAMRTSLKEADIVIFSGGTDIQPTMYGEFVSHAKTQIPDKGRDKFESQVYLSAVAKKKCLVGICRGAQLLNVLNGGRLWQHVNNHTSTTHPIMYTNEKGERYGVMVTSDHHQMMRPAAHARVLATAKKSTFKATGTEDNPVCDDADFDPEIVWYPRTKSLCYQPHPEWGLASDCNLFLDCIRRTMIGA